MSQRSAERSTQRVHLYRRRRGFVLMAALACVIVASVVAASVMQRCARHRLQVERRRWQLQSDWLAQAGLERGAHLAVDPSYRGEVWQPVLGESGESNVLSESARVVIEVTAVDDATRSLKVTADCPDHGLHRSRSELEVRFAVSKER